MVMQLLFDNDSNVSPIIEQSCLCTDESPPNAWLDLQDGSCTLLLIQL